MTHPYEGPHHGPQHEGFGFSPIDPYSRRAVHRAQREALREMRSYFKNQARTGGVGFGGGPFGAGFGPGGQRGGHRGRSRGRRGDVRAAILALLAERPMHGYEMIQEIGERSNGLWRPSPGSVYPTLQLLVDEGLITGAESAGSKRLFELTDDGRETAAKAQTPPWQEIVEGADPNEVSLYTSYAQLAAAVFQGANAATPEQQKRILDIVNDARRGIYGVLGEAE